MVPASFILFPCGAATWPRTLQSVKPQIHSLLPILNGPAHLASISRRRSCLLYAQAKACLPGGEGKGGNKEQNRAEWEQLIWEFEERSLAASSSGSSSISPGLTIAVGSSLEGVDADDDDNPSPPQGRPLGQENPDQYETLPLVEAAAMTAATAMLWYFGRVLRLDSILMLFYSLPTLIIMMRWGPSLGNSMVLTTTVLILGLMGPLYGILYALNTGILAFVLANALWLQWNWALTILAGCAARFAGIFLQLSWSSLLAQSDVWKLVGAQVKATIDSAGSALFKLMGKGDFAGPTMGQVYVAIAVVLALHSLFYVLLTHLSATMILDRLFDAGHLMRRPKLVPFLNWLKALVNKRYDAVYGSNVYRPRSVKKPKDHE
jgi:Predicted membrane protein (DUF2232)